MRNAPVSSLPEREVRSGFTVVELLVVTVLGSLILMAAYNVLITNQRAYTVNAANMQGQQTVRAGMELLFSELREISPEGGDLLRMDGDSVTIRVMRSAALICDSTAQGSSDQYRWDVVTLGDTLESADSVWLFAEHDSSTVNDDVWFKSTVVALVGAGTCSGQTTQAVRFGWGGAMGADTPTVGGLIRTFETYTYGLGIYDGSPYLVRKLEPNGQSVPLVGPLRSGTGVRFQYLNQNGSTTAVAADVRQIVVTLRTEHEARDTQGELVRDSLRARIYTRN
jgi:prepilin-type N-terminal cleavage/methylation domain-containing protein